MEKESADVFNIQVGKFFINNYMLCMIRIKYNNIDGMLNLDTNEVLFYQFKYNGIREAIQNIESDIKANEQEIEIFNNLLGDLFTTSD